MCCLANLDFGFQFINIALAENFQRELVAHQVDGDMAIIFETQLALRQDVTQLRVRQLGLQLFRQRDDGASGVLPSTISCTCEAKSIDESLTHKSAAKATDPK